MKDYFIFQKKNIDNKQQKTGKLLLRGCFHKEGLASINLIQSQEFKSSDALLADQCFY